MTEKDEAASSEKLDVSVGGMRGLARRFTATENHAPVTIRKAHVQKAHLELAVALNIHPTVKDGTKKTPLQEFLRSKLFHQAILALILIDLSLVIVDLAIVLSHCSTCPTPEWVETLTHKIAYSSLAILCVFIVEFIVNIFAFGFDWLMNIGHFFDVVVVLTSFIFDIVELSAHKEELSELVQLIVVLRLWRIARITHAIAETALEKHEWFLEECEDREDGLLDHIKMLEKLLRLKGVDGNEIPELPLMHVSND